MKWPTAQPTDLEPKPEGTPVWALGLCAIWSQLQPRRYGVIHRWPLSTLRAGDYLMRSDDLTALYRIRRGRTAGPKQPPGLPWGVYQYAGSWRPGDPTITLHADLEDENRWQLLDDDPWHPRLQHAMTRAVRQPTAPLPLAGPARVYVDDAYASSSYPHRWRGGGRMVADTQQALQQMAAALNLKPTWVRHGDAEDTWWTFEHYCLTALPLGSCPQGQSSYLRMVACSSRTGDAEVELVSHVEVE